MRGEPAMKQALQEADEIYLSPVVIGELLAGFLRGKHTDKNREELERFLSSPRVEVLSVDEGTAERYAPILNSLWSAGAPIPTNDIWIAANAMQYGLAILTTDRHFLRVPQVMVECLST